MQKAVQRADRIIADSFSTAKDIIEEFPESRDRVRTIYLGAGKMPNPLHFKSLEKLGISKPYILFVGTIEPRKNLKCLMKAFSFLPKKLTDSYQLVIAGGKGWGGVNMNVLAKKLNINDKVIVTGYVTDHQISTLYAHAYCLVMPSLYEGFGLPI